jgi:hypothetical protein
MRTEGVKMKNFTIGCIILFPMATGVLMMAHLAMNSPGPKKEDLICAQSDDGKKPVCLTRLAWDMIAAQEAHSQAVMLETLQLGDH